MAWKDGPIDGCGVEPLRIFTDERGWLAELFRHDELPRALYPAMGYVSMTHPGVARGPHEHEDQTDLFVFFQGTFRLYLWDARPGSPTEGHRQVLEVGTNRPVTVTVPPGVVHGYRNVGDVDALLINCPNRLYAGAGRREPVDENRHEDRADSPFVMD